MKMVGPAGINLDPLSNPEEVIAQDSPLWDVLKIEVDVDDHDLFLNHKG